MKPLAPKDSKTETMELLTWLREEGEKNRESLRDDADASRKLLTDAAKWISLPLTAALVIAGAFGANSIISLQKSLTSQLKTTTDAAQTQARDIATKTADTTVRKVLETTDIVEEIKDAVGTSPTVATAIDKALVAKQQLIVTDATAKISAAARAAIQKEVNEQNQVLLKASQASAAQFARSMAEASKNSAEPRPKLRGVESNATIDATSRVIISGRFFNEGRFDATHIVAYALASVSEANAEARKSALTNLARQIALDREGKKGRRPANKIAWGKDFFVEARTSPLSLLETQRLQGGMTEVQALYFLEYQQADGESFYVSFCQLYSGDLQDPRTCGAGVDVRAIVLGQR